MADKQQLLLCAETALYNLQAARNKLFDAHRWGRVDIMFGGMFASMAKHNRLHEVGACLQAAREDCLYLQNELQDQSLQLDIDLAERLKVFDIFFDNLFTDMAVQNKVVNAMKKVDQTIYQLQNIIARLKA